MPLLFSKVIPLPTSRYLPLSSYIFRISGANAGRLFVDCSWPKEAAKIFCNSLRQSFVLPISSILFQRQSQTHRPELQMVAATVVRSRFCLSSTSRNCNVRTVATCWRKRKLALEDAQQNRIDYRDCSPKLQRPRRRHLARARDSKGEKMCLTRFQVHQCLLIKQVCRIENLVCCFCCFAMSERGAPYAIPDAVAHSRQPRQAKIFFQKNKSVGT
jgi:hypothetical protein